jgi:hypothetical protein
VNTHFIHIVDKGGLNGDQRAASQRSPAMPTLTHLFYFAAIVTTVILLGVVVTQAKPNAA